MPVRYSIHAALYAAITLAALASSAGAQNAPPTASQFAPIMIDQVAFNELWRQVNEAPAWAANPVLETLMRLEREAQMKALPPHPAAPDLK